MEQVSLSARSRPLGLGLVGAGDFGRYCLAAYRKVEGLRLAAVCDNDPERLSAAAREFGATPYASYDDMLADPAIDIVAVNTPPRATPRSVSRPYGRASTSSARSPSPRTRTMPELC